MARIHREMKYGGRHWRQQRENKEESTESEKRERKRERECERNSKQDLIIHVAMLAQVGDANLCSDDVVGEMGEGSAWRCKAS